MWVLNQWGFTDSCEHKHDPSIILVRAWDLASLEYLCDYGDIDRDRIFTDMPSDIPFRVELSREEYATALYNAALDVSYPKFKPAVADNRGNAFNALVHRWWGDFRQLLLTDEVRKANDDAWYEYAERNRDNPDRSWLSRNIDSPMPSWAIPDKKAKKRKRRKSRKAGEPTFPDIPAELREEVEEAIALNPTELDIMSMTDKEYEAYCDQRALEGA